MADTFNGIITADGKKRQLHYANVFGAPVSDKTLSEDGGFADAKVTGDNFAKAKAETDSLKGDLGEIENAYYENIFNLGYDISKTFEPFTTTMTYNGIFYNPTQGTVHLGVGGYIVALSYKLSNFLNAPSRLVFTQLFSGGNNLYFGMFNSENVEQVIVENGSDAEGVVFGYVNITQEADYHVGMSCSSINGVTFTFEFKDIAIFKLNGDYEYNTQGLYVSLVNEYGFLEKYRTSEKLSISHYKSYYKPAGITGNTLSLCNGEGTFESPYTYKDGNAGISTMLNHGKIIIPVGFYDITTPIEIDNNSTIEGECWGYSADPSGVFGIENGSVLKVSGNGIVVDTGATYKYRNGVTIENIGFQGSVVNSNTQGLVNYSSPNGAGIALLSGRVDQWKVDHIDCCGLPVGMLVKDGMNVDACTFDWINADGCNVGIMILTNNTYYAVYRNCLLSDCPAHGIIVDGGGSHTTFDRLVLVRNCGGITDAQASVYTPASAYFDKIKFATIKNCFINNAGQWVEYFTTGSPNPHYRTDAVGLYFNGNYSKIFDNYIQDCQSYSMVMAGSNNDLHGNVYRSKAGVHVTGNYNSFTDETFHLNTTKTTDVALTIDGDENVFNFCRFSGKIVINGKNNRLCGVSNSIVTDNGTGNVITD